MSTSSLQCPQCGSQLPNLFRHAKLTVCEQCDSTIFLEDEAAKLVGTQSVLTEMPSLIQLKQPFTYQKSSYLPVGHIRFSYGFGYWDEWWLLDNASQGRWMSIDEGDFAFEQPEKITRDLPGFERLKLGQTIRVAEKDWQVTELGKATCEGFRGELPEVLAIGDTFFYAHLSGPKSALLTLEYHGKAISAYLGRWVDPFEITVAT